MTPQGDSGDGRSQPTVGCALIHILVHPVHHFVVNWNWKSAIFSVINRGTIFLIATMKRGTPEISVAVAAEALFSATASGVYGAFTQAMRFARPQWLARSIVALFLPAVMLGLDYLVHYYTGMQHMRLSLFLSALLSVLSSLFCFDVMRQGALVVGNQGESLSRDLKRMPALVLKFIAAGPRSIWDRAASVRRKRRLEIATQRRLFE